MSTETDIGEIKTAIMTMGINMAEIKMDIAVIKTTSTVTQGDIEEIKSTLKNHDGRIRQVEVGLETQKTRTDTQSVIVGVLSMIGSTIAALLGINR